MLSNEAYFKFYEEEALETAPTNFCRHAQLLWESNPQDINTLRFSILLEQDGHFVHVEQLNYPKRDHISKFWFEVRENFHSRVWMWFKNSYIISFQHRGLLPLAVEDVRAHFGDEGTSLQLIQNIIKARSKNHWVHI